MYTAQHICVIYGSPCLIVFVLEINWQNRGSVIKVLQVNCIPLGPTSVIVTTWSNKPLYRFYGGINDVRFKSRGSGRAEILNGQLLKDAFKAA
jgi:hypothetical protein